MRTYLIWVSVCFVAVTARESKVSIPFNGIKSQLSNVMKKVNSIFDVKNSHGKGIIRPIEQSPGVKLGVRPLFSEITVSPEIQTKLASTIIDVLAKFSTLVGYYFLWRVTTKVLFESLGESFGKIVDHLKRDPSSLVLSDEIRNVIQPNSTFVSDEIDVLGTIIAPSTISDTFRDLGGLNDLKKSLQQQFFTVSNTTKFHRGYLQPCRSALFYGPPGCGKTATIRALCHHLNCPILSLSPSSVQRKYYGESTQTLRAFFNVATKLSRCAIVIDEIDALFSTRCDDDHGAERSVKTEFMQLWDELQRNPESSVNVFVFGATNRPQDLDPAILRRFDRSFLVAMPSDADRRHIFQRILRDVRRTKDFSFDRCAELSAGYTASDIRALCRGAVSLLRQEQFSRPTDNSAKLRPLRTADMEEAARTFYPTNWAATAYTQSSSPSPSATAPGSTDSMQWTWMSQDIDDMFDDDGDDEDDTGSSV